MQKVQAVVAAVLDLETNRRAARAKAVDQVCPAVSVTDMMSSNR